MDKEVSGGFYVTLASNASAGIYPQNKIWNFRTKLAKSIHTKQPYEVGLIEAQYPCSWHSFPTEDATMTVHDGKTGHRTSCLLVGGLYESIGSLLLQINKTWTKYNPGSKVILHHEGIRNRIYVEGDDHLSIVFRGKLAAMLGFDAGVKLPAHKSYAAYAPHPTDIHGGCYNMFIYSDIVDHQLVGDSYVPLLRSINITDTSRRHCIHMFDKPHYVHVARDPLGDIEIDLKSDQNTNIKFTYGKVILKLHFRPVKQ